MDLTKVLPKRILDLLTVRPPAYFPPLHGLGALFKLSRLFRTVSKFVLP
jgi:hypothetical protein